MYAPAHFAMGDFAEVQAFVRAHPFATIAAAIDGAIHFAYGPVVLDAKPSPLGGVRFHVARANPLSAIADGTGTKLSFMGAHAYISPDWYETQGQVPTWNYTAAEGAGRVRRLNEDETYAHLDTLAAQEEAWLRPKTSWTIARLDPKHAVKLLKAIVGFEVPFDSLEGKAKLSQNKSQADIAGAIAGLESRGDAASIAAAMAMRARVKQRE